MIIMLSVDTKTHREILQKTPTIPSVLERYFIKHTQHLMTPSVDTETQREILILIHKLHIILV